MRRIVFSIHPSLVVVASTFGFKFTKSRRAMNVGVFTRPRPIPENRREAPASSCWGTYRAIAPGPSSVARSCLPGPIEQRLYLYQKLL